MGYWADCSGFLTWHQTNYNLHGAELAISSVAIKWMIKAFHPFKWHAFNGLDSTYHQICMPFGLIINSILLMIQLQTSSELPLPCCWGSGPLNPISGERSRLLSRNCFISKSRPKPSPLEGWTLSTVLWLDDQLRARRIASHCFGGPLIEGLDHPGKMRY